MPSWVLLGSTLVAATGFGREIRDRVSTSRSEIGPSRVGASTIAVANIALLGLVDRYGYSYVRERVMLNPGAKKGIDQMEYQVLYT